MSKEKKIEVKDRKRWLIHLFSSLGIWFIFMLILITFINNINDHVGVIMLIYVISFVVMIAYWIYTYKIFNKYVSVKEYREINKNIADIVLKKQLTKQGFDEDEISEILKDRPISNLVQNQQSGSVRDNVSSLEDLKEDFNVTKQYITKQGLGMYADSESKQIAIINPNKSITYVDFKDIYSYEIKTLDYGSGNSAIALASITGNTSLYGLGMANNMAGNKQVVGFMIELTLKDLDSDKVVVHFLNKKLLNNSVEFAQIEEIVKSATKLFDKIIDTNNKPQKNNLSEIKELKELLDMGAITQEEFNEKKKELLK